MMSTVDEDPYKFKPSKEIVPYAHEGDAFPKTSSRLKQTPEALKGIEAGRKHEDKLREKYYDKKRKKEEAEKKALIRGMPQSGGGDDDSTVDSNNKSHSAGKILKRLRKHNSQWFSKLRRASWPHKFLYFIYVIPMVLTFLILALVLFLPWTFIRPLRPNLWDDRNKKWARAVWSAQYRPPGNGAGKQSRWNNNRDVRAPYGYGPEGQENYGFWTGFCKKRTWEMYELLREIEHGARRQGLQVVGALSGIIIFAMQVWMMAEEYRKPQIKATLTDLFDGGKNTQAIQDAQNVGCGYYLGSGTALWSGEMENLAWYGFYHGIVALLGLCLVLEEVFNVRMGLLAPQWSRTGTGWSMMFLATCCVTSSQDWGIKSQIRTRYLVLYLIFFSGTYNVLRGFLASLFGDVTLIPASIADDTYRNNRLPLRPWSEDAFRFWKKPKHGTFYMPKKRDRYAVEDMSWTQRIAISIGDQAVANAVMRRKEYTHESNKATGSGHRLKVRWKSAEEEELEAGQAGRAFWHGCPTRLPPLDMDDLIKCIHSDHEQLQWYCTALADWDPVPALIRRQESSRGSDLSALWMRMLLKWYDIRRCWAIGCSVTMVLLHGWLLANDVGVSSYKAYASQYDDAVSSWKANGGPSETDCAYYGGSSLSVMVQFGSSASSGILSTIAWAVTWHCFLISMCLGVFFVSLTNNRTFGMHFPFGITLIGPRLSSNSIGWTIGFVAFATLQLGLFPTHSDWTMIARGICYACVASWVTFIFPNEPMRNIASRNAFWPGASQAAVKYMESKKFYHEPYKFDPPL
ncbi:hypothetical protein BCR39DRAFT_3427 [Naematelia encephala]|uniref:Uncharacterized protein n=1 Tax=Naematelia encephala TaxID=71784 RepID=A0A1Y2BKP4_9TREE|nr:hypothetical protein BCR39DRAFT_3427 [Naematelia encephala]